MNVKILQNINGWVGGKVVPLHADQELDEKDFIDDELTQLIRGGYARMITPAVKVTSRKKMTGHKASIKVDLPEDE